MTQSILQVDNLTKSFGDLVLFQHLTFGLSEGDRVGLIARNGSGKSTLLSIIAGVEGYDEGSLVWRSGLKVGYLPQNPVFDGEATVGEVCGMPAGAPLDGSNPLTQMLTRLGLNDPTKRVAHLSGGQIKRLALAHTLALHPDVLLLDEPTNHLDLTMVEWLQEYLSATRSLTLLMVTHDRYFLDHVCNRILELDGEQLYAYKGNYNYYLEKRAERVAAENAEIATARNLLRKELDWMRRQPQARGHKSRSRIEAFYALEQRAHQRREEMSVKMHAPSTYIGSKIFEAHHVNKTFPATADRPARVILRDYNYVFARREKMGIIGANGVGKSTFIKMLLGLIPPDSGQFDIGETVRFGYYSQEGIAYKEDQRVIDAVRDVAEYMQLSDGSRLSATELLSQFLFPSAKQYTPIRKLSGGERRRLYLCTVLMRSPNFLVLDEPTNDLDIPTLQVLEDYLQSFAGCVIVVSHDRFFMDKVVDHLLVMQGEGTLQDYPGGYSDYREWTRLQQEVDTAEAPAKNTPSTPSTEKPRTPKKAKLSFKEQKEYEALTQELPLLEEEKKNLETAMSSGTLSSAQLLEKASRIETLMAEIDEKEMRWLELSEKA